MRPGALLIKIGGAHRPLEWNGAMPAKSPRGRGHLAGRNRASAQVPGQQIFDGLVEEVRFATALPPVEGALRRTPDPESIRAGDIHKAMHLGGPIGADWALFSGFSTSNQGGTRTGAGSRFGAASHSALTEVAETSTGTVSKKALSLYAGPMVRIHFHPL